MSTTTLDYVIIFGQGIIIVLLGYSFLAQGRNLIQPELRVKSGAQMIYTGLALVGLGALIALIAIILAVIKK